MSKSVCVCVVVVVEVWTELLSVWRDVASTLHLAVTFLLFVLQDRAGAGEGGHMAGIYQPMAARVIECELKVKPQTAERESMARGLGFTTGLFIISLKGRSAVQ